MADFIAGGSIGNGTDSSSHSRQSSMSSERSQEQNKENTNAPTDALTRRDSEGSDMSSGQLILREGGQLNEESRTETSAIYLLNPAFVGATTGGDSEESTNNSRAMEVPPSLPTGSGMGTARHKVTKAGSGASSIPEVEISIPNDGCLASFSADAMATFLRCLRLEHRLVNHLHRQGLDGRKFGRLKDTDLDSLQLNNPVIVYFRDRTALAVTKKNKQRLPFVL